MKGRRILFPCGETVQEVGLEKTDAASDAVGDGVAAGDGESGARNVGGVNRGSGKLFSEGYGDAAGARADVCDSQTFARGFLLAAGANFAEAEAVECDFNDVLGFRAGDHDVGSDREFEAPEFLLAGELLRGLAGRAARNQDGIAFCLFLRNRFVCVRVNPRAVMPEHMKKKKLRGESVRRHACLAQPLYALLEKRARASFLQSLLSQ